MECVSLLAVNAKPLRLALRPRFHSGAGDFHLSAVYKGLGSMNTEPSALFRASHFVPGPPPSPPMGVFRINFFIRSNPYDPYTFKNFL